MSAYYAYMLNMHYGQKLIHLWLFQFGHNCGYTMQGD